MQPKPPTALRLDLSAPRRFVPPLKEPGGFWLPNEIIDVHARQLGARGIFLFTVLVRQATLQYYPSVVDLATTCNCSAQLVRRLLEQLHQCKLLNTSDLQAIHGFYSDEDTSHANTLADADLSP